MRQENRRRLNRIEARGVLGDEPVGPVIQALVVNHEEAAQSRELDELLTTGRAYLDENLLPERNEGESFLFSEILAAIVRLSPEDIESEKATERQERLFL